MAAWILGRRVSVCVTGDNNDSARQDLERDDNLTG